MESIVIGQVSPASREARSLVEALDAELLTRYPDMPPHGLRDRDVRHPLTVFLIGTVDGEAVACGATRPVAPGIAEIKRMYVVPAMRGRGYARQVLAALEASAQSADIGRLVLETADGQPEAIALYRSAGYVPIEKYGEFVDNEFSRCFGKALERND